MEEYKNKKHKKIKELVTLKDYEDFYLQDGVFVYPDSLPYHIYNIDEEAPKILEGEIQFLKKYERAIKTGKKIHLQEESEDESSI